jgi:hypothetical protein
VGSVPLLRQTAAMSFLSIGWAYVLAAEFFYLAIV